MLFQYLEDGNLKKVQEFFRENPDFDVNAFNEEYASWPLEWAIDSGGIGEGKLEIISFLLKQGADPNSCGEYPPLWLAASSRRIDLVNLFLAHGTNPSISSTEDDSTPLMVASANGDLAIVKVLVEAGASLHAEDWDGKTALEHALEAEQKEVSDYLSSIIVKNK